MSTSDGFPLNTKDARYGPIFRHLALIFIVALSLTSALPPASVKASKLMTCNQILDKYPNGVAKNAAGLKKAVALGYAKPTIAIKVYNAAQKLDQLKSNTVCVVEAKKRNALKGSPALLVKGLPAPAVTSANEPPVTGHPAVSTDLSSAVANFGGTCMVAMRDGKIIGEWYSGGRTAASQSLAYSSSKPLTTAVIGAAQKLGLLSIDQSIADFIPEFKGTPKSDITIRHLLTHKSGLKSSNSDFSSVMRLGSGITSAAINLPLTTPPGSTYDYESSVLALQLLIRVVEKAVSEKFSTFADNYVLRPLGMTNSVYKGDQPATNFETGDPWLAGGLSTTCRDLTRLGHLFQLKGLWAGQQIFTSEFAAQAIPLSGYGFLLSGGVGGYGHDGACGQMVFAMPSGVTISSMSNSSLASPLMGTCEPARISSLRQATIAVANLL